MTIKERLLVLELLRVLQGYLAKDTYRKGIPFVDLNFLTRKFMEDMLRFQDKENYTDKALEKLTDFGLYKELGNETDMIEYIIHRWKKHTESVPKRTQDEANKFFTAIGRRGHYLEIKPVGEWDEYDVSNYYGLLFRHGKTKRAYVIYIHGELPDEHFAITTRESYYFDTEEEAEDEIFNILREGKYQ